MPSPIGIAEDWMLAVAKYLLSWFPLDGDVHALMIGIAEDRKLAKYLLIWFPLDGDVHGLEDRHS